MKSICLVFLPIILLLASPVIAQEEHLGIAPSFELEDLNGNRVSFEDYRGKYLVIHFAATWCPFCNAEAPFLEELYRNYKGRNVEVLIIDVKECRDLVTEKLQERFNFSFPVLLDLDGKVAASFAPEDVLPDLARDEVMLASNVLIGPDGNILFLSLLDSRNFDAKLVDLREVLDASLAMR
ncbi:TlpA family protein disulfide reductase [Robertkochia marina]|uniref:TlpA family protein disulfide reductase n=1 Tax=Robertkochia marina TaxID=1227945 RepID=A0A4S3M1H8_9FLAO|nr:TlpA disulfide reductase family protein [Robertkochia marina]THD68932.1 TlpA family protein disulfide reductase [Robertkochia marina]TRZ44753.1 TlpA family protein disulfide reductase [Robertkochia marina]